MLPPAPTVVFAAKALATAAAVVTFGALDCNPSLFFYDTLTPPRHTPGGCVWIIGASSGIGEEMACQIAATSSTNAPKTIVLSSRNVPKLEQIATALTTANPTCRVTLLPMDVTKHKDMENAVERLGDMNIEIDTAVLNAGFGHLSPATETLSSTAEAVFQGNALWPMVLIPMLSANNHTLFTSAPHVVVTTSVASYIPIPLSSTYCAAKHALLGYFRSLQAEEPEFRIQLVAPGPVDTDFHQNHQQGKVQPKTTPKSRLKMPVQRCAHLILRAMQQRRSGEYWIAQQPLLTLLYVNTWFPGLVRFLIGRIGPKRVDLWRRGYDLYDPQSWRERVNPDAESPCLYSASPPHHSDTYPTRDNTSGTDSV